MADILDRAGKPIFSLIAVVVPYISPFVIGSITVTALVNSKIVNQTQANLLMVVLEGIGVVGLSGLVYALIQWARSRNPKAIALVILLGIIDLVYFLLLVTINVALEWNKVSGVELFIKALVCLIPLLSGGIYGYYRVVNSDHIEKVEAKQAENNKLKEEKELADQIRQEKNELKLKGKMIKAGMNPMMQYQATTQAPETKNEVRGKSDWRLLSPEEKYEVIHVLSVPKIMAKYPIAESTAYMWKAKKL